MKAYKNIADLFLLAVIVIAFYFVYVILKPFIWVFLISAVIVVIFYPLYEKLLKKIKLRKNLASILMTLLIVLIVLIPLSNFVYYLSIKSIDAYNVIQNQFTKDLSQQSQGQFSRFFEAFQGFQQAYLPGLTFDKIQEYIVSYSSKINQFLLSSSTGFIRGTTQFVTNLFLVVLTVFFLFRDGDKMVDRIMKLTPLPNKYDKELYQTFRNISYSSIVSSLVTAIVQGIVGGIGFALISWIFSVNLPSFFLGVAVAFASLIPVGAVIVWLPLAVIIMALGNIFAGLGIIVWGTAAVGLTDNALRPLLIKGKNKIHELLLFFSIVGGIAAFGFWGIVFGPVILAIFLTLLHIYELEYESILER